MLKSAELPLPRQSRLWQPNMHSHINGKLSPSLVTRLRVHRLQLLISLPAPAEPTTHAEPLGPRERRRGCV